jgi:hypothetical protein
MKQHVEKHGVVMGSYVYVMFREGPASLTFESRVGDTVVDDGAKRPRDSMRSATFLIRELLRK